MQLIIHAGNSSLPFTHVTAPGFETVLSECTSVHINTVRGIGLSENSVDYSNKKALHAGKNDPVDGMRTA